MERVEGDGKVRGSMEGGAILIDDSKRNAGGEGRSWRYGKGEAERGGR